LIAFLKKLIANDIILVMTGLPNLAITASTIFILTVVFHWVGIYTLLAYLIGQVFSVQYSVTWAMFTKSNFKVLGREWHFAHRRESGNVYMRSPQGEGMEKDRRRDAISPVLATVILIAITLVAGVA